MDLFDIGLPIAFICVGFFYAFMTPRFKDGLGLKTVQTLRGREEWKYGHKCLGGLLIFYGILPAALTYVTYVYRVEIPQFVLFCFYLTLIATSYPLLNKFIVWKFGRDEDLDRRLQQQRDAQDEYYAERRKKAEKKKEAKRKEADKKKMLKQQQKIAKQRKKEKGR